MSKNRYSKICASGFKFQTHWELVSFRLFALPGRATDYGERFRIILFASQRQWSQVLLQLRSQKKKTVGSLLLIQFSPRNQFASHCSPSAPVIVVRLTLQLPPQRPVDCAQPVSLRQRTGMAGRNASADDVGDLRPLCRECLEQIGPEALCSKACFAKDKHKKAEKKVYHRLLTLQVIETNSQPGVACLNIFCVATYIAIAILYVAIASYIQGVRDGIVSQ